MIRVFFALVVAIALWSCTVQPVERQSVAITPSNETADAAVVRRPIPDPAPPPVASQTAPVSNTSVLSPFIVVPPKTQYVCVSEMNGVQQQTSIEFSTKVAALCRKHPEMGPCKYERDVCRRSNGRVYTAEGVEITKQTEAEYDKKVMRVVFRAN